MKTDHFLESEKIMVFKKNSLIPGVNGSALMVMTGIVAVVVWVVLQYSVGNVMGFGETQRINPATGRPYGQEPAQTSFEPRKVDAHGRNLEPTKTLKQTVRPMTTFSEAEAAAVSSQPLSTDRKLDRAVSNLSKDMDRSEAASEEEANRIANDIEHSLNTSAANAPTPSVKENVEHSKESVAPTTVTVAAPNKELAAKDVADTKPALPEKPVAEKKVEPAPAPVKPVVASPVKSEPVVKKEISSPVISDGEKTAPVKNSSQEALEAKSVAETKPAAETKPVVESKPATESKPVAEAKSIAKSGEDTKSLLPTAVPVDSAKTTNTKVSDEKTTANPLPVVCNSEESVRKNQHLLKDPVDKAIEWSVADWQRNWRHQKDLKAKFVAGQKHSVSRIQTNEPAAPDMPALSKPAPMSPKSLRDRDAFLTQVPQGLPGNTRQETVPKSAPSASPSDPMSAPVNYGGQISGIKLNEKDILISDAIVEIPKGEGYEALISACGQGLLVELGIPELDAQGKPVLKADGTPKLVPLKRGTRVKKDQILGKQNDREHAANKLVAQQQLVVAEKEAKKQLEIEVAKLAVQVAESEYLRAKSANEKMPGAVSPEEVVQRAYEWKRADKSAEKAIYDLGIKGDEVEVRKAQVVAADAQVLDRKLVSPIDGFVDDVMQNEGQWLREGDNILRIIRLDKVMICGKIDAQSYSPDMVDGKPVTIFVQKPGSPLQKVKGVITYARQIIESGKFYIYAEADNTCNDRGFWLLNPGTIVTMVVHR